MRTAKDFVLATPSWLIDEWLPIGHRVMDIAPEGSHKTRLGVWIAICVAAGIPVFGMGTFQGPAIIFDEETPPASLDNIIYRFCRGLNIKYDASLPLYRFSMIGFRFGVKSELKNLLDIVKVIKPTFIRMDSLLAMIPNNGINGMGENFSRLGEIVRDDLTALLDATNNECTIMLSAHTKKMVSAMTLEEVVEAQPQTLVRGHSSIIGEGCDTAMCIHKEVERDPTRFSLITKPRRLGIPVAKYPMLIELEEQEYSKGWARLTKIDNSLIPPTDSACSLYPYFAQRNASGGFYIRSSEEIVKKHAFLTKPQIREGVHELFSHKVIMNDSRPQMFIMNPNEKDIAAYYLNILKTRKTV